MKLAKNINLTRLKLLIVIPRVYLKLQSIYLAVTHSTIQ